MIQLILGGARSGKSRYAEQLAAESDGDVVYVATAQAGDDEMKQRIEQHRQRRPQHWQLVEESVYLADVLKQNDLANRLILVDCLTLWLSNLLCRKGQDLFDGQRRELIDVLPQLQAEVILVSNEVGHGIVPLGQLNRRFVDESGWLHQDIAQIASQVVWIIAGLPSFLKPKPAD